jgi:hypothetical protein
MLDEKRMWLPKDLLDHKGEKRLGRWYFGWPF